MVPLPPAVSSERLLFAGHVSLVFTCVPNHYAQKFKSPRKRRVNNIFEVNCRVCTTSKRRFCQNRFELMRFDRRMVFEQNHVREPFGARFRGREIVFNCTGLGFAVRVHGRRVILEDTAYFARPPLYGETEINGDYSGSSKVHVIVSRFFGRRSGLRCVGFEYSSLTPVPVAGARESPVKRPEHRGCSRLILPATCFPVRFRNFYFSTRRSDIFARRENGRRRFRG